MGVQPAARPATTRAQGAIQSASSSSTGTQRSYWALSGVPGTAVSVRNSGVAWPGGPGRASTGTGASAVRCRMLRGTPERTATGRLRDHWHSAVFDTAAVPEGPDTVGE